MAYAEIPHSSSFPQRHVATMADHIGIAACSAPGAALCYQTICTEAAERMGCHAHPEVSLHGYSFAEHVRLLDTGDWLGIGQLLAASATKLASIGAKFVICPDNTAHQALDYAQATSPIPWLHIGAVVAQEAERIGARRLGILGTRFLMDGPVYKEKLEALSLQWAVPPPADREAINGIIFQELVLGRITAHAQARLSQIIEDLHDRQNCDAVILGCTELPLIVAPDTCRLPVLDSTRLLARAAIQYATCRSPTV